MDLGYEVRDSYAEISAGGRLNMVSAPKLRELVAGVVAAGTRRIVVL
jgi:anti-sigma B factor antagonist